MSNMSQQSPKYDYNAPSFVDFVTSDLMENDGADGFFDVANEAGKSACDHSVDQDSALKDVAEAVKNISIHAEKENQSPDPRNVDHQSSEYTRSRTITLSCKTSTSATNVKKEKMDYKRKHFDSPVLNQRFKFISLAEGVQHFQNDTPERFHRRSRKEDAAPPCNRKFVARHVTIPKSPALISQTRNRPVHYLSHQEREDLEVQEIKQFKLKANALNERILKTVPSLGKKVEVKPPTKIEPFQLTEFKKKEPTPNKPPFLFSARPVPKQLFQHQLGVPEKQTKPLTTPSTPSFIKSRHKSLAPVIENKYGEIMVVDKEVAHFGISLPKNSSLTAVCPFSFEDRDKLLQKKKEDKLQQVLEEEKKAREFHAQPVPRYIKKASTISSCSILPTELSPFDLYDCSTSSRESVCSKKEREDHHYTPFKARPATVLKQKPFEPKKEDRPLKEITSITLNTELRAEQRQKFENLRKLKEGQILMLRQQMKQEQEYVEAEEVARLRREAVHKANPVRRFKALNDIEKKPLTSPKTPNFSDRFNK